MTQQRYAQKGPGRRAFLPPGTPNYVNPDKEEEEQHGGGVQDITVSADAGVEENFYQSGFLGKVCQHDGCGRVVIRCHLPPCQVWTGERRMENMYLCLKPRRCHHRVSYVAARTFTTLLCGSKHRKLPARHESLTRTLP